MEPFGAKPFDADNLPSEVARPMLRRLNAEQDRYVNLARQTKALERIADALEDEDYTPVPEAPVPTLRALLRHWYRLWRDA
jgi:hypothetical protein